VEGVGCGSCVISVRCYMLDVVLYPDFSIAPLDGNKYRRRQGSTGVGGGRNEDASA
jgi:hypothetical protein